MLPLRLWKERKRPREEARRSIDGTSMLERERGTRSWWGKRGENLKEDGRAEYTRRGERWDSNREGFQCLAGYLRTVPLHNCPCHGASNLTCTRRVTHASSPLFPSFSLGLTYFTPLQLVVISSRRTRFRGLASSSFRN